MTVIICLPVVVVLLSYQQEQEPGNNIDNNFFGACISQKRSCDESFLNKEFFPNVVVVVVAYG